MNITTQDTVRAKNILVITSGVMLLLAVASFWPYGYFQILRWVIAGVAIFNAHEAYKLNKLLWFWVMVVVAILFNPIAPIHLAKEVWIIIDVIVALLMFISIKKI